MKIVAVMQNQWFRNPDTVRRMIESAKEPEKLRRRLIHYALFAGCKSGRVLKRVFGDLCDTIIWDEASREIGGHAASVFPADREHLRALIESEQPDIVIAFGKVAFEGLVAVTDRRIIEAPHPAARQPDTLARLGAAHDEVREMIAGYKAMEEPL